MDYFGTPDLLIICLWLLLECWLFLTWFGPTNERHTHLFQISERLVKNWSKCVALPSLIFSVSNFGRLRVSSMKRKFDSWGMFLQIFPTGFGSDQAMRTIKWHYNFLYIPRKRTNHTSPWRHYPTRSDKEESPGINQRMGEFTISRIMSCHELWPLTFNDWAPGQLSLVEYTGITR